MRSCSTCKPVEHTDTDNPTTRAAGSWGNRQVVGDIAGAELHECMPQHNAVSKKSDRVAAQRNLTRDPSKIPKSLKEFCPLAYNPIILYKSPYSDNQELVRKYMGQATICQTMELGWEESNPTPLPPTVPDMPTSPAPTVPAMPTPSAPTVPAMPTPLAPTVPAMAQMTPPPTLPVKTDMMTTDGLVPNLNMMTQMMTKISAQT